MTMQVMGTAYCAADPVLTHTKNSRPKTEVPVYIKDTWTDLSTGQIKEVSDQFRCVFFGENARRANEMIMKGSQIIITSAKLRTVKNPTDKRITYTQIWVDKWELPAKVMMTKKLYQEVYQSEMSPIKIGLSTPNNKITMLVMMDCHQMNSKFPGFEKKDLKLLIKLRKKSLFEYCLLTESDTTYSTKYIKVFEYVFHEIDASELSSIKDVNVNVSFDEDDSYEITFPAKECIELENKK